MDRVDFIEQNEFHIKSRKLLGEPVTPSMISILLKSGIARTEKQAVFILFAVMAIALTAAWFLIFGKNDAGSNLVVDAQGNSYTFEEYIDLVRQGRDPLLP